MSDMDPRVEAVSDVAHRALLARGLRLDDYSLRTMVERILAAADAARPPLSAEDEARAVEVMATGFLQNFASDMQLAQIPVVADKFRRDQRAALAALRREFDIVPKVRM